MALTKGIGKLLAGGARKTGRGAKLGTAAVVGGGLALGASSILGGLATAGIMGMKWPGGGGKGGGLAGATDPAASRDSSIIAGMRPSDVIKKENIGKLKADADLPTALGWIAKAASAIYKTVYQNNREIIRVQEMLQGPVASRAKELRMESGGGAAPTVIMMGGGGEGTVKKDDSFPWWLPMIGALGTTAAFVGGMTADPEDIKPPRAGRNPRGSTPAERQARLAEIKERIRLRNQRLIEFKKNRMSTFDRFSMESYNANKAAAEAKRAAAEKAAAEKRATAERATAEKTRIEAERRGRIAEGRNLMRKASSQSMTDYRASETARQTTEQNRRIELTEDSRRSQGRQIAEAQAERQRVINEQNKYRSRTTNIKPGAQYLGEPATSRGLTAAENNLKGEIKGAESRVKGTVIDAGTETRRSVGRSNTSILSRTTFELAKIGPTLEIMNRRLGGYGDALKIANKAFGMTQTGQTSIAETKAIDTKIKGADKIGIKSGGFAGMLETFTATEKGATKIGTVRTTVGSTSFAGEGFTAQTKGGIHVTGGTAGSTPLVDALGEKGTFMASEEAKQKTMLEKLKGRVPASWRGPLMRVANLLDIKKRGAAAREMPRGMEKWINRAMLAFLAGAFAWVEIRYQLAKVPGGFVGGPYGEWYDKGPNGEKVHWSEEKLNKTRNKHYKELLQMLALVVGAWFLLGIAIDIILGMVMAGGLAIPGPGWLVSLAAFAIQFFASTVIAEIAGRALGILPPKETPEKIIRKRFRGYNPESARDNTDKVRIGTGVFSSGLRGKMTEGTMLVEKGGEAHLSSLADKSAGTSFGAVGASSSFLEFVADQEGFSGKAYTDAAGITTVGYGHTGSEVSATTQVSEPEARRFLVKDIQDARRKAKSKVNGRFGAGTWEALPQHSKDMLTDIEFNVRGGLNTFQKFTKAVVTEDWETARKEFKRYYTDTSGEKKPLVKRNKDFFARFLDQAGAKQSAAGTLTDKRNDLIHRFQDVSQSGYGGAAHTSGLTLGEYLIREIQSTQAAINALATVIPTLPPTRGGVGEDGGNATTVINVQGGNTTVQQATTNFQPWRSQLAIPGGGIDY